MRGCKYLHIKIEAFFLIDASSGETPKVRFHFEVEAVTGERIYSNYFNQVIQTQMFGNIFSWARCEREWRGFSDFSKRQRKVEYVKNKFHPDKFIIYI